MNKKRIVYGVIGLGLIGYCGYQLYEMFKNSSPKEVLPSADEPKQPPKSTAPAKTVTPPSDSKIVPASEVLKNGEKGILGRTLVGKNDTSGIYDTILHKVGTTKKGEELGKAFKADKTGNDSYNIKYQDKDGQYRIVNSVSVDVKM